MIGWKGLVGSISLIKAVATVGVCTVVLPSSVLAAEYVLGYQVESGFEYNDNVRLSSEDEVDISGLVLSPSATLSRNTERLESDLALKLDFNKYDEQDYDTDGQDLKADFKYFLERGELNLNTGFKRDSTRTSELEDTGLVGNKSVRKETAVLGLSGFQMVSERNGVNAGINISDVSYESQSLIDYSFYSGFVGWLYQWSSQTKLRVQGYANYYENEASFRTESDGYGLQLGLDSQLSERLEVSFLGGSSHIKTDYEASLIPGGKTSDKADTYILEANLKYFDERNSVSFIAKSATNPSGNGYVNKSDSIGVNYSYMFSEKSRFNLGLSAGQIKALDDGIDADRDYARGQLRIDRQFAQNWLVAARYTYTWQDNQGSLSDADSNALYLSLIYKPVQKVWSR